MNKFKRVLCLVLPLVLVITAVLCVVISGGSGTANADEIMTIASSSDYNGQVVYVNEPTGASVSGSSEKGGLLYIGSGATYEMRGGTIANTSKKYGGAVYVDSNATFIMSGGTITSCEAKYGGAIYVAKGGKCQILGGTITGNKAETAPAICVEEGGTLEIGNNTIIEDNQGSFWLTISESKEIVGLLDSDLELYTIEFGSYPQTYVGDSMREELENWFSSSNPTLVKTYETGNGAIWNAYEYKGDLYARGTETKKDSNSVYKDGTSPVTGRTSWFKVEPIKWYILNYDEWKSGQEKMELYTTQILTAQTPFSVNFFGSSSWSNSNIRTWCNETFINEVFNTSEQNIIESTTLKNSSAGEYEQDSSTWTGNETSDKIYFKSYYDLYDSNGIFKNDINRIICSGTDFAKGNELYCSSTIFQTIYGTGGKYWLRSVGSSVSYVCCVDSNGVINTSADRVSTISIGVRPALRLSV